MTNTQQKFNQEKIKLENALRFEKNQVKDQKKAINIEKNEIQRQGSNFSNKETMYQSQIRKHELNVQSLKDKIYDLTQKASSNILLIIH